MRLRAGSLIALLALAPALLAAERCGPLPGSARIETPKDGATVDRYVNYVRVAFFNVEDASVRVALDGVDRTAEFTVTPFLGYSVAEASLLVPTPGAHTIAAEALSGGEKVSAASSFTLAPGPFLAPNDVAAGALPLGGTGTVRGEVTAVTYRWIETPEAVCAGIDPAPWRYVLLKTTYARGLNKVQQQWGVALRLSREQLEDERIPLPYPGDVVEATGVLGTEVYNQDPVLVLDGLTDYRTISSPNPVLADVGEACGHDMDCRDDLICNRATEVCETFARLDWFSDPRGVNGACDEDADCPIGQFCDPAYITKNQSTEDPLYGVWHMRGRDTGRRLCQVHDRAAPVEAICPRTVTVDDFMSGRFKEGKEVCVRGRVFVSVFNPGDLDTHSQMVLDRNLVVPTGSPPVPLVGAATENTAPMRDPAHPLGALADLPNGKEVVVLGTVKSDCDHEWFEVHPYKWFRALD